MPIDSNTLIVFALAGAITPYVWASCGIAATLFLTTALLYGIDAWAAGLWSSLASRLVDSDAREDSAD